MAANSINKNKSTGDVISVEKLRDYSQDPFVKRKVENARRTLVKSGLLKEDENVKSDK